MKPNGGGKKIPGRLERLAEEYGGFEKVRADFLNAGATQFGSGWAWLAIRDGKLEVTKTPNGENPLMHGAQPILGVDVWEHSYYIDYRNARPKYLEAWFDNLVNWDYVDQMLAEWRPNLNSDQKATRSPGWLFCIAFFHAPHKPGSSIS